MNRQEIVNLHRLQQLARDHNNNGIVRHIFLQRLLEEFNSFSFILGEETSMEKLTERA